MDNSTGIYQIWTAPIDFSVVSVEDNILLPITFELKQNYPNPFNPFTKIGYQIKEQGFFSLVVFDALGNELVKLVDEHKVPGYYEVEFGNANLLKNKDLSSGIYFYRLSVNGNYDTKSMVLIK
ncbi:MAG: T9SS type A sorting domain-containing protein [Bacteroidetes bacterium]|nr:T9SS type A sorting domain-containing protein [Bacteroidota bacterium]